MNHKYFSNLKLIMQKNIRRLKSRKTKDGNKYTIFFDKYM